MPPQPTQVSIRQTRRGSHPNAVGFESNSHGEFIVAGTYRMNEPSQGMGDLLQSGIGEKQAKSTPSPTKTAKPSLIPPAEAEANFYAALETEPKAT